MSGDNINVVVKFEGPQGSGKTVLSNHLRKILLKHGYGVDKPEIPVPGSRSSNIDPHVDRDSLKDALIVTGPLSGSGGVLEHDVIGSQQQLTMSGLGLPEKPVDLNTWIDEQIAAKSFCPHPNGSPQAMWADAAAEIARGAVLHLIADKATLIDNLANYVHRANVERGWWNDPRTGEDLHGKRNFGELMALAHSELSEALEARRKGDKADDKLPHRPGWRVELIDCIIRLLDTLGSEGQREHPAGVIFVEKDQYNANRADHKPENRLKAGGKVF